MIFCLNLTISLVSLSFGLVSFLNIFLLPLVHNFLLNIYIYIVAILFLKKASCKMELKQTDESQAQPRFHSLFLFSLLCHEYMSLEIPLFPPDMI